MEERLTPLEQEVLLALNEQFYREKVIAEGIYTYVKGQIVKGRLIRDGCISQPHGIS